MKGDNRQRDLDLRLTAVETLVHGLSVGLFLSLIVSCAAASTHNRPVAVLLGGIALALAVTICAPLFRDPDIGELRKVGAGTQFAPGTWMLGAASYFGRGPGGRFALAFSILALEGVVAVYVRGFQACSERAKLPVRQFFDEFGLTGSFFMVGYGGFECQAESRSSSTPLIKPVLGCHLASF